MASRLHGSRRVRDSDTQPGYTTTVSRRADRYWPISDIILPIRSESGEPSPLRPGTIIAAHVAARHRSPEERDRRARCTLPSSRRGTAMATSVFYGWKIVIVCFLIISRVCGRWSYGRQYDLVVSAHRPPRIPQEGFGTV